MELPHNAIPVFQCVCVCVCVCVLICAYTAYLCVCKCLKYLSAWLPAKPWHAIQSVRMSDLPQNAFLYTTQVACSGGCGIKWSTVQCRTDTTLLCNGQMSLKRDSMRCFLLKSLKSFNINHISYQHLVNFNASH